MKDEMKRVNVIIPQRYHDEIMKRGLKLSGVVREALEDQLNPETITLSVSSSTHDLYMELLNGQGCSDKEFEPFLRKALSQYVEYIIEQRQTSLHKIKEKLEK
ncbi:MAG: hypothetical protein BM556_12120 [Bacteriovorax sp. MedPE-SWde]|nr:MAG: hypothetical protein BM556_12120 [Bacteriovorax sp. MedPE-SWde]